MIHTLTNFDTDCGAPVLLEQHARTPKRAPMRVTRRDWPRLVRERRTSAACEPADAICMHLGDEPSGSASSIMWTVKALIRLHVREDRKQRIAQLQREFETLSNDTGYMREFSLMRAEGVGAEIAKELKALEEDRRWRNGSGG